MEDQTTSGTTGQTPGWDVDPYGRHELRYWDGAEWTDHVSDHGVAGHDPADRSSPWAAMATAGPDRPSATQPATAATAATTTAPTPGPTTEPAAPAADAPASRPPGPSWAWDRPATAASTGAATGTTTPEPAPAAPPAPAPAPTPSPTPFGGRTAPARPSWATPAGPTAAVARAGPTAPVVGGYADLPGNPKPQRGRLRWVALGALAIVVIVVGVWFIRRPPDRIDAGPPAATPAGFRVVSTPDYRIAVPSAWRSQVITSADRERLGDQLDRAAPGTKDAFEQAEDSVDGTIVLVTEPAGRENVNVVPLRAMRGDPSDVDTIRDIRGDIQDQGGIGAAISGMTTAPADVHGFPAATLSYTIKVGPVALYQVATVVQTGDHVFQVTVSAPSPDRAAELSRQMVATFDPA